ncbi:ZIP family metal transporter [Cocleimonas sp. KMM 6892]|uniref:ZIP family metal transporter n=1 Tax=unclassified Cocleimonas TaxID=2639732 RepID=UPI002DBB789D|nr:MULTISPECIES: ZIP family metal transporter [unclassified Cocleimonas]MEB8433194.1 ZIP family metal transporter [Cocleimonas sp. KMM 6892]MEC4715825.1 ZIP family metal transporter [Cocleimonas sp. KMM 6895]MEC4745286.1 ZIP family metal transporter [Cocleimonas sp. KMM 6896]
MNVIMMGVVGSLVAGLLTGVGALGVFFFKQLSAKLENSLLSFAAGIMLAASFFSLILPSIEYGEQIFDSKNMAVIITIIGIMSGAVSLSLMHRHLPHEHFLSGQEGPDTQKITRIWLFVFAITLHNFPEGMAVGVGFAGGDISNGMSLATGIGLQNIPEGLAVSVSLLSIGYSKMKSFFIGFLTGLAEPIGGLFGSVAVSFAGPIMPWALAFAAGAMLFIISDEIIPETHRSGFQNLATFSLLIGFVCMMYLDATLG